MGRDKKKPVPIKSNTIFSAKLKTEGLALIGLQTKSKFVLY